MNHIERMKEIVRIHDHRMRNQGPTDMVDRLSVEVLVSDLVRMNEEFEQMKALLEHCEAVIPPLAKHAKFTPMVDRNTETPVAIRKLLKKIEF